MSNLTPFEIRLELLKMAKELLTEEYYGKKDQLSHDWQVKVESAKLNGQAIPEHPTLPPYPTENEIITKAQALNGFVSNISAEKSQSKKSA